MPPGREGEREKAWCWLELHGAGMGLECLDHDSVGVNGWTEEERSNQGNSDKRSNRSRRVGG